MKKILYVLLPLLFSFCFVANAQFSAMRGGANSLRADAPTTGFCWGDRTVAMDKIAFVGLRQAAYLTAFVQTPNLTTEHKLKSISFPWGGETDANGQILVLDKSKKVIFAQDATIENGWNTFNLSSPLSLNGGVFYVGFAGHSTKDKNFVIGFDGVRASSLPTAAYMSIEEKKTGKFKVGEMPEGLMDMSMLQFGSLMTVMDIEGSGFDNIGLILKAPATITGKPNEKKEITLSIKNSGSKPINNGTIETVIGGKSQTADFTQTIASGSTASVKVNVQLPEAAYGVSGKISLKSVNGAANGVADLAADVVVNAPAEGAAGPVKNILIEEFTTERCPNCPRAKPIVEELVKQLDAAGYGVSFAAHHAGYYTDWLTQSESDDLLPYVYAGGGTFAPGVAVNRWNIGESNGIVAGVSTANALFKLIDSKAKNSFALAEIDDMVFTGEKGITISGKLFKGADKSNAYMHVYICENGIKGKSQAGGGPGYIHEGVILKFLFPITGSKLEVGNDLSFKTIISPADVKAALGKAHDKSYKNVYAVAFITGALGKPSTSFGNRFVYTSTSYKFGSDVATQDVVNNKPMVKVVDNCIKIEGDYDSFQVFNMAGNIVATSENTPLMGGMYIVRVSNGAGDFTYKVAVE